MIELSLCADCVTYDANGWDSDLIGRPLPDPAPMSLLEGYVVGVNESDHMCEGHFGYGCDGCDTKLGGLRYCYEGLAR